MQLNADTLSRLTHGNVVGPDGEKIGGIGQIYTDDQTGEPAWVTVKTGLFGTAESFVPLSGASVSGDDLRVNFDKATVKDAPRVDADGSISPEEEDTLYTYYGLGGTSSRGEVTDTGTTDYATGTTGTADYATGTTGTTEAYDSGADQRNDHGTVGHDTSGPTTDDAMTLSEEQVQVGTQSRDAGRARLRKYVVTENVTQTVPVSHEEVRIEREPITDANVGDATSGPDISEEEHEVVLHEEVPVVQKDAVPVERVRLNTETVTEEQTVSEEVRKEQIDTDTDTGTTRGR